MNDCIGCENIRRIAFPFTENPYYGIGKERIHGNPLGVIYIDSEGCGVADTPVNFCPTCGKKIEYKK